MKSGGQVRNCRVRNFELRQALPSGCDTAYPDQPDTEICKPMSARQDIMLAMAPYALRIMSRPINMLNRMNSRGNVANAPILYPAAPIRNPNCA
jgi:hypothetical protein